ncbi:MAG TPA: hypothetical protein ENF70_01635 [Deltaproteobacteria bacterium]|nr:hypothetical protein [Deltaproteobacteria bacterium]
MRSLFNREGIKDKAGDLLRSLKPGSKRAIVYQRRLGRPCDHRALRSAGSWFSVACAAGLGLPVVVFPVEGPRALRSLGAGRWVRLRCWAGAFRWVPARQDKERCTHGLIGSYCSLCQKGGTYGNSEIFL